MGTFTKFSESGNNPQTSEYIPSKYRSDTGGTYSSTSFGAPRGEYRADLADVASTGRSMRDSYERIDNTPRAGSSKWATQGAIDTAARNARVQASNRSIYDSIESPRFSQAEAEALVPPSRGTKSWRDVNDFTSAGNYAREKIFNPIIKHFTNAGISAAGSAVPGGSIATNAAQGYSKYTSDRNVGERVAGTFAPIKQQEAQRNIRENSAGYFSDKAPTRGFNSAYPKAQIIQLKGQLQPASTSTMYTVASNGTLRDKVNDRGSQIGRGSGYWNV